MTLVNPTVDLYKFTISSIDYPVTAVFSLMSFSPIINEYLSWLFALDKQIILLFNL